MPSVTAVIWVTFSLLGCWCLILLLGTLYWVRSLRQRNDPFLINFLLTTLLATVPPCLSLFAGHQHRAPPKGICFLQSILMDGIAPMFGTAFVILILHTWANMQAICSEKARFVILPSWVKWLLLSLPYVVLVSWCMAALAAALKTPIHVQPTHLVYCYNNSDIGNRVRSDIGFFMLGCGFLNVFFEIWTARLLYLNFPRRKYSVDSDNSCFQLALRILIFAVLQLGPIVLATLRSLLRISSPSMKNATQIVESMNAMATFLVFGTQKDVLRAWNFWKWRTQPKPISEV